METTNSLPWVVRDRSNLLPSRTSSSVSSKACPLKRTPIYLALQHPLRVQIQNDFDEELHLRFGIRDRVVLGLQDRWGFITPWKLSDTGDCEINAMVLIATETIIPVPSLLRVIHAAKSQPCWRHTVIRYIPGPNFELVTKGDHPLDLSPLCTQVLEDPPGPIERRSSSLLRTCFQ